MTVDDYRKILQKACVILRKRPTSATELAKAMKVSRPAAYERINALIELGTITIVTSTGRVGKRGPQSTRYHVTAGEVP